MRGGRGNWEEQAFRGSQRTENEIHKARDRLRERKSDTEIEIQKETQRERWSVRERKQVCKRETDAERYLDILKE